MDKKTAFERMITELGRENGEEYIAKSMTLDMREIRMVSDGTLWEVLTAL